MTDATPVQRVMRTVIGLGTFALLGWLLVEGRDIPTPTLFALLALILTMSGLGNVLTDLFGNGPGGGSGGMGGS